MAVLINSNTSGNAPDPRGRLNTSVWLEGGLSVRRDTSRAASAKQKAVRRLSRRRAACRMRRGPPSRKRSSRDVSRVIAPWSDVTAVAVAAEVGLLCALRRNVCVTGMWQHGWEKDTGNTQAGLLVGRSGPSCVLTGFTAAGLSQTVSATSVWVPRRSSGAPDAQRRGTHCS